MTFFSEMSLIHPFTLEGSEPVNFSCKWTVNILGFVAHRDSVTTQLTMQKQSEMIGKRMSVAAFQ